MTELHPAVRYGSIALVRILLRSGAGIDTVAEGYGTPLCIAAAQGNEDMVRLLIRKGVNVRARAEDNATALHYAAATGQLEVASMFPG